MKAVNPARADIEVLKLHTQFINSDAISLCYPWRSFSNDPNTVVYIARRQLSSSKMNSSSEMSVPAPQPPHPIYNLDKYLSALKEP